MARANVNPKCIPFRERYVNLALDHIVLSESMVSNLKCLYEFIDNNTQGNSTWKYGNAYTIILKRARAIAGNRKSIISRRQVKELIKIHDNGMDLNVKIPYASEYIFCAIFDIYEQYRKDASVIIPPELSKAHGEIRREIFYKEQCEQYKYKLKNQLLDDRPELKKIRLALLNDLCSDDCSLGKEF